MAERRERALYYFERQPDEVRERTQNGIERYRKGDMRLSFIDKEERPVKGVKVWVEQKKHAFRHGANLYMLDGFASEEKNRLYREKFAKAFNYATLPFYWSDLEPEKGKPRFSADSTKIYRRPAPDLCLSYCKEKKIAPKAHCLHMENFTPDWLRDASVAKIKEFLEGRYVALAERYGDAIPFWEVTADTLHDFSDIPGVGRVSPFFYEDDLVEWSFQTAEKYFSRNRLSINDSMAWDIYYSGNRKVYYMQIERLLSNGIPHLDTVGMSFHCRYQPEMEAEMASYLYNPVFLYEILDLYARFGKKLEITGMTLPAFSSEEEDEEVQAELLRQVMHVFFSHPAMEAVSYWNLVDGTAAFAPEGDMTVGENRFFGGLLRYDLLEKPAYRTLCDLFGKEWHTSFSLETGEDRLSFRGFYGDYDLQILHDGKAYKKECRLLPDSRNEVTVVLD